MISTGGSFCVCARRSSFAPCPYCSGCRAAAFAVVVPSGHTSPWYGTCHSRSSAWSSFASSTVQLTLCRGSSIRAVAVLSTASEVVSQLRATRSASDPSASPSRRVSSCVCMCFDSMFPNHQSNGWMSPAAPWKKRQTAGLSFSSMKADISPGKSPDHSRYWPPSETPWQGKLTALAMGLPSVPSMTNTPTSVSMGRSLYWRFTLQPERSPEPYPTVAGRARLQAEYTVPATVSTSTFE